MKIVELKDCPDGQHVAIWLFNGKMWSDTVKIKNHKIIELFQDYFSPELDIEEWVNYGFHLEKTELDSLRIVINEPSI